MKPPPPPRGGIEPPFPYWFSYSQFRYDANKHLLLNECQFYSRDPYYYQYNVIPENYKLYIYCNETGAENKHIVKKNWNSFVRPRFQKSNIQIIFAEYSGGADAAAVEIEHLHDFCYVGNELFTPEFVFRCLPYSDSRKSFNMKYKLTIMDNQMTVYELDETKYMYVELDELVILDI